MTAATLGLILAFTVIVLLLVKPFGAYIANVMEGRPIWPLRLGAPLERLL
jgi:K+-transporting ATPase A subunit